MDWPKNPAFAAKFGPQGVLKCKATATDNSAPPSPRFGAWGKQTCEDTGALTIERMKTVDEECLASTLEEMDRACERLRLRQHEPQAWWEEWGALAVEIERKAEAELWAARDRE